MSMRESDVIHVLRKRYAPEEWCFLAGVRKATGFSYGGSMRTADAVAMNMFPSRGLPLVGFEVKVSKGDWQKELKDPSKAESICRYMDNWYIAAPEGIVQKSELPSTWGLIVIKEDGSSRVLVQAPVLTPESIPKAFWASLFRESMRQMSQEAEIKSRLEPMVQEQLKIERNRWESTIGYEAKSAIQRAIQAEEKLKQMVDAFGGETWNEDIVEICKVARKIIIGEKSVDSTYKRIDQMGIELHRLAANVVAAKKVMTGNMEEVKNDV